MIRGSEKGDGRSNKELGSVHRRNQKDTREIDFEQPTVSSACFTCDALELTIPCRSNFREHGHDHHQDAVSVFPVF
jgi:hypothetical protein